MTQKLTLKLADEVIRKAKRYARDKGQSLSELVEHYFRSLIDPEKEFQGVIPSYQVSDGVFQDAQTL